jgi:signal transduction histidine kinase
VRPFTEKQIALVKTFADQAVIAIENVRLFQEIQERTRELQISLEEVRALSDVSRAVSSSLNIQDVLDAVAGYAVNLSKSDGCGVFEFNQTRHAFDVVASHNLSSAFLGAIHKTMIDLGKTTIGQAAESGQPIQVPDVAEAYDHPFREFALEAGFRSLLTVPMTGDHMIRGIVLLRRSPGQFDDRVINLLTALASQSKVAIENARLFSEIEDKGRQIEAANRHKSEFLSRVSHDLRTPLNAIIGFTRIVLRRTEGQIPDLQKENLQKVIISSEHLLNLINTLLDLAKIEAGKMEVLAESFRVDEVIHVTTATIEPLLKDGRVCIVKDIAPDIPPLKTDRDKLKQILLNLLGNAAKFTEQGEIRVSASQENGTLRLAVTDTGIGMKQASMDHIFDEFRQAETSTASKYGGTGLGLAIVKKFTNLMGGDISVESEEGKGTKFTIKLPISLKG